MTTSDYEKLGVFYLGKEFNPTTRTRTDDLLLYDSKDLVTHAVCVGMTGSGKTGLCLGLLEEAAIDGIPALIIDPKGDLSNLLLTFPNLTPEDFRPWINEDDAGKKGLSPDEFAAQQAALWSKGLGQWDQDGQRIARLKSAAEFVVYTPGSSAGVPVSVLKSFGAPPQELIDDAELFRERVSSTATSLLGLMGIDADPIRSREHILLSALLSRAWSGGGGGAGRDVTLEMLIQQIQTPPMDKLGVMSLESVFPAKERFQLAMALNNLVASPGFAAWLEGEPLDIQSMLYTPAGKPRHAIFSIAHLSDAERMFFVALLLNQTLGWVRTQSGTSSLRAVVYMDEIAGYFPPTANPPSKQPLLTLMKQARAFGVGIVLATQNPVDLDYKGLANAGTWFIGRLQTERDKARVLDGLEGAAGAAGSRFNRAEMDRLLSSLGPRVFVMNNVHEDHPVVMETRWCLSYLRGPLTRQQIKQLMDPRKRAAAAAADRPAIVTAAEASASAPAAVALVAVTSGTVASGASSTRPVLPAEIPQFFVPCRALSLGARLELRPSLLGMARVYYSDTRLNIDQEVPLALLTPLTRGPVPACWDDAEPVGLGENDLERDGPAGASFADLPPAATLPKSYTAWQKDFADTIFKTAKLELFKSPAFKLTSRQSEGEREFRLRLSQLIRESRDQQKDSLRQKYAPKLGTLQERMRRAQASVEVQKQQSTGAKLQAAVSIGAAVLGALMGRKAVSATSVRSAGTAMGRVGRTMRESGDVSRAQDTVESVSRALADLNAEFERELAGADTGPDASTMELEAATLKPKKTNIKVRALVLAWMPWAISPVGEATRAW